jgi:hypothetical protein
MEEKLIKAKAKYGRTFPVNIPQGRVKPKSQYLRKLEKLASSQTPRP